MSVQVKVQDNWTIEKSRFSPTGIIRKVHLILRQIVVDVDQNT